jgi:hypothetical protein
VRAICGIVELGLIGDLSSPGLTAAKSRCATETDLSALYESVKINRKAVQPRAAIAAVLFERAKGQTARVSACSLPSIRERPPDEGVR